MNEGYFRIPRSLTQSLTWLSLPLDYQAIFIKLIEMAAYKETTFVVGGEHFVLKVGQILTTFQDFASHCGISKVKIQRILHRYGIDTLIDTETVRNKTLITITHKDTYDLIANTDRYEERYGIDTVTDTPYIRILEEQRTKNKGSELTLLPEDLKNNKRIARKCEKDPLSFSFEEKKFVGMEPSDVELWQQAYPSSQVALELLKMQQWLLANPQKSKNKKLWRKFITNWLSRDNEHKMNRAAYATQLQKPPTDRLTPNREKGFGKNVLTVGLL